MTQSTSARLAWFLWAVTVCEIIAFAVLAAVRWPLLTASRALAVQQALVGVAYPLMGAIIASRRPRNPIGWIFLVIGLSTAAGAFTTVLSTDAPLGRPGTPWGADVGNWLNQWIWAPGWLSVPTFVLLLFPDGRLPSPRLRHVARLAGFAIVAAVVGGMLSPDNAGDPAFHNPAAVLPKSIDLIALLGIFAFVLAAIGSVAGLVVRFKRSRGGERRQLEWFAFAGIATVLLYIGLTPVNVVALQILGFVAIPLLPTATAVAILRYRLYDIDQIISRTVTYALVTAVVAGVYVLVVLVPTAFLVHGRTPTWLVAAGTIAAAAVFRPMRRSLQSIIDRRFNRSRYDAAWAIESFATRLRDEVDIDELSADLQTLVHQTMEPAHVSIWLKRPST